MPVLASKHPELTQVELNYLHT